VKAISADFIDGSTQVMDYYGSWPSFHDADFVSIAIEMGGPTIRINFRFYDWDDLLKKANRPNITLLWHEVEDLTLAGIEELGQNAIGEMELTEEAGSISTLIQSTGAGTTMQFRASRVAVTHFDPQEKWDYEADSTDGH
jgi:hypothetical protein